MGTPEPQVRTLQKAGRSGGGLVSHVYSVRWNLCLRATAAANKNLSAALVPTGAQVRSLLLPYHACSSRIPVFQGRPDCCSHL